MSYILPLHLNFLFPLTLIHNYKLSSVFYHFLGITAQKWRLYPAKTLMFNRMVSHYHHAMAIRILCMTLWVRQVSAGLLPWAICIVASIFDLVNIQAAPIWLYMLPIQDGLSIRSASELLTAPYAIHLHCRHHVYQDSTSCWVFGY